MLTYSQGLADSLYRQGGRDLRTVCFVEIDEYCQNRVATGVKNRVQRLKGLGNSIQPQVAYEILKVIAEIEQGGDLN